MNATRTLHASLLELLPDAVLVFDVAAGRFVLANAAAERLLSAARGELARLGLRDLVGPLDAPRLETIEEALRSEGRWRGELWIARPDGTLVPAEVEAQHLTLDGRALVQLYCRDVSARRRSEAARWLVDHAATRLASAIDLCDVLRVTVAALLPGLADAALLEVVGTDDAEPAAVAAFAEPAAGGLPRVALDEAPGAAVRDSVRGGSTLATPLEAGGRRIGLLTLGRSGGQPWEPAERELVAELACHAAHAADRARRLAEARGALAHRAALLRILSAAGAADPIRRVHEVLLEEALATLDAEDGGIARWDAERGVLVQVHSPTGRFTGAVLDRRRSMVGLAAAERLPMVENDYQRTLGRQTPAGRVGAKAVLAVPLVHRDALLGSISVSQLRSARRFQPGDARRLEQLASAAALTLDSIGRHRLAGARLVAQEAAHLLNNDLALSLGTLDVIQQAGDVASALGPLVETALRGLDQAASHLAQLQRLARVETRDGPLGPRLDLARSVAALPS